MKNTVIVVGAGPGGLSVAGGLKANGIDDVLVIDCGTIGQSWLDYPPETRLLSESSPTKDENMICDVPVSEVCANIPHPTHVMYQRYLHHVVTSKNIQVKEQTKIEHVTYDEQQKLFILTASTGEQFEASYLVWAAGMYSTPNEKLSSSACFIHYSRIQQWDHIQEDNLTVVGSANGASEVVMQLAKPGRTIRLLCSHTYEIPEPIDCLWKENMQFVKDLEKQGLVDIVEDFRVKEVRHDDTQFIIESSEGKILTSPTKPIICIGFLPNITAIKDLVKESKDTHDCMLELGSAHQSTLQPNLYVAGAIGKMQGEEGFIRGFRVYAHTIAEDIAKKMHA
jgi:putative flavoprotein involved in K+ transport